jgi:hypothetical protein
VGSSFRFLFLEPRLREYELGKLGGNQIDLCLRSLAATYSPTRLGVVPSAQRTFTVEFGMGSGVDPSLKPPGVLSTVNLRMFYHILK